jgi:hypothetical protein
MTMLFSQQIFAQLMKVISMMFSASSSNYLVESLGLENTLVSFSLFTSAITIIA